MVQPSEQPADLPARWRVRLGRFAGWLSFASFIIIFAILFVAAPLELPSTLSFALGVAVVLVCLAALVLATIARRLKPLLVCVSTFVVALVAVPFPAGESSEIRTMRAVHSAESTYASSCANGGYAIDLADLAKAPPGSSQGFISPELDHNGVIKSGYIITLARNAASGVTDVGSTAATCNGSTKQPASSYFASANPKEPGVSGTRYFATDTRGIIYVSISGPVPNPIPPDGSIAGRAVRIYRRR